MLQLDKYFDASALVHLVSMFERLLYAIVSTVPPSTRNAAPVVAEACTEQT